MIEIGGYFNLELSDRGGFLHDDGILLNSCRNALEFILRSLKPKRIWLPKYTCDSVLQPVKHLNLDYNFYSINNDLEIVYLSLNEGDVLLYTNYFGIKDAYTKELAKKYGQQLIIDNAQSYYSERIKGIATIYSPRKFFGVPDGGIAYVENPIQNKFKQDKSYDRCKHLLRRYDEPASEGYADFRENDEYLDNRDILLMSELTKAILRSINYDDVEKIRMKNFIALHKYLSLTNLISLDLENIKAPLVYPYFTETGKELHKRLIENKVYVATYWPNMFDWCNSDDLETLLAENCLPLPIDQRYNYQNMNTIINVIENGKKK